MIDRTAPDGPLVLVGHSMGGMTIMAFAELFPELFGDRVVGTVLMATSGGLHRGDQAGRARAARPGRRAGAATWSATPPGTAGR